MAEKNYGIHDIWTDLDKQNDVDIKSVDDVIESVKINGEEAGGGGGGDFSTATVTFINQKSTYPEFFGSFVIDDEDYSGTFYVANPTANATTVYTVALYKGKASISNPNNEPLEVSGSAEEYNEEVIITGDCTIEIIDMA